MSEGHDVVSVFSCLLLAVVIIMNGVSKLMPIEPGEDLDKMGEQGINKEDKDKEVPV